LRDEFQAEREKQNLRKKGLEDQLRKQYQENDRLRQDYYKLAEMLQSKVQAQVVQTFSENNFI